MPMKRKQIYLDAESEHRIRTLARTTRLSEAEHIRRAIASYVKSVPDAGRTDHPLVDMIGICDSESGPIDAAARHDAYLYGAKRGAKR
ncbi:MAG: CopG family transcriptional regulator [Acidobacteria bacterium]|nr:CopG family transcriptional regulator [Acidobacteriota bacterium]